MTPTLVLMIAGGATLVWLCAYAAYQLQPERVTLRSGAIEKKYKGRTQQVLLDQLSEIRFHYHAVVGFVGVWEFIDVNANCVAVNDEARGMKELKENLERVLPRFSLVEFENKFRHGNLEDSIEVWKSA